MPKTVKKHKAVELFAIPGPSFSVGDRVKIAGDDTPSINIIKGWCYVPSCPNDPRHKRPQYPVQGSGIHYFVEQQMSATNFYETVHEEDLTLA